MDHESQDLQTGSRPAAVGGRQQLHALAGGRRRHRELHQAQAEEQAERQFVLGEFSFSLNAARVIRKGRPNLPKIGFCSYFIIWLP